MRWTQHLIVSSGEPPTDRWVHRPDVQIAGVDRLLDLTSYYGAGGSEAQQSRRVKANASHLLRSELRSDPRLCCVRRCHIQITEPSGRWLLNLRRAGWAIDLR